MNRSQKGCKRFLRVGRTLVNSMFVLWLATLWPMARWVLWLIRVLSDSWSKYARPVWHQTQKCSDQNCLTGFGQALAS